MKNLMRFTRHKIDRDRLLALAIRFETQANIVRLLLDGEEFRDEIVRPLPLGVAVERRLLETLLKNLDETDEAIRYLLLATGDRANSG